MQENKRGKNHHIQDEQGTKNKPLKITNKKKKTNLSINNLMAANNTTCTFHVFEVRAVVSIEQKRSPYLSVEGKNGTKSGKIGALEVRS